MQHDLSAAGHDVGDDDLLGIVDVHKVRHAAAEAVPGTQDGGTRIGIARVHMAEDDLGGDLLFGGQAALGMLRQTGLHVADVHRLVDVLQKLVDAGNTVVVIEHNLDVIKVADYILDLGPEGGDGGGRLVVSGTPEEVAQCEKSYTGRYLGPVLAKTKAAMQAKSE